MLREKKRYERPAIRASKHAAIIWTLQSQQRIERMSQRQSVLANNNSPVCLNEQSSYLEQQVEGKGASEVKFTKNGRVIIVLPCCDQQQKQLCYYQYGMQIQAIAPQIILDSLPWDMEPLFSGNAIIEDGACLDGWSKLLMKFGLEEIC